MNHNQKRNFALPAEWQPQSGIQLTWPHAQTDWKPYLYQITATFIDMTRIISAHEKVIIVSPHIDDVIALLKVEIPKEQHKNLLFYHCRTNDTWARDHAFLTVEATTTAPGFYTQHHLLDFKFNGWGEKFPAEFDNKINSELYFKGAFNGALENHNDFVLEGGSIESDGNGTIFTTSLCLMAPQRNQPMSKEQIETRLKDMLYAERIVWIDHGHLTGDDTDGHIDTIVRCAPSDTLLYVGCDKASDPQYEDFKALEVQLQSLRTKKGLPYRLLRLPMPDAIYDGDDRLPATYANFVIINGAIIYPTYAQPEKDSEAKDVIQQAFPDREVIGIDARTVIRQHGSLHCLTMQFPEGAIATERMSRIFD